MKLELLFTGRPDSAAAAAAAALGEEAVTSAHLARDHGFHAFVAGQHFLTGPYRYLQPLPLLARLIPETGEMRLATGVLLLPLLGPSSRDGVGLA